ncbi:hypothetical protein CFS9_23890 [Flavobacterium sp. CFS9]|uniref:DUF3667 domain-containing protein n=1 Tax=Flavobacterium sp. CFS9 TaxID=3143118 RepID=A0AAT9H2Q7_9FLAO
MNCKNCNNELSLNFCSNCGQPSKIKRIDSHYIIHEIEHVLHFERGILYTVKELVTKPGQCVKEFITENRARLVKPIIFIIITSLIYSIINHFFHIEEEYAKEYPITGTTTISIFKWMQSHYGYANIIQGSFIAVWLRLFFRKYAYNFFEILILLCFVMGIGMLISAFFLLVQGLTHFDLLLIANILGIAYCSWAIGQFFDKTKPSNYLKAFISYMLGILTSGIFLVLIGTLIDLLIKH